MVALGIGAAQFGQESHGLGVFNSFGDGFHLEALTPVEDQLDYIHIDLVFAHI